MIRQIEKGAGAEAREPLTRPADAELSRRHLRGDLASFRTPSIWFVLSKSEKLGSARNCTWFAGLRNRCSSAKASGPSCVSYRAGAG